VFLKLIDGHLDHAAGSLYDSFTSGDDGACLLLTKHCRSDFLRVSKLGDARLDNLNASSANPILN
jgi:hypothetical protein